jgi:hypothetical protein
MSCKYNQVQTVYSLLSIPPLAGLRIGTRVHSTPPPHVLWQGDVLGPCGLPGYAPALLPGIEWLKETRECNTFPAALSHQSCKMGWELFLGGLHPISFTSCCSGRRVTSTDHTECPAGKDGTFLLSSLKLYHKYLGTLTSIRLVIQGTR